MYQKTTFGPRKVTAVGYFEYNVSTNGLTEIHYGTDDSRVFTIILKRNHDIVGDVKGTWSESGAQQLLDIDGDFGTSSPLPVDYGYYGTRDKVVIPDNNGIEVNMRDYASDVYLIAVTHRNISGNEYYRYFVFE